MSALDAYLSLTATLRTVSGVRVSQDAGQTVDPPALVVLPPTVTFDAYSPRPTLCTFEIPLVVRADDRAVENLLTLLQSVADAIHASRDAALTEQPKPGSWGTPPLPSYLLTIEVTV